MPLCWGEGLLNDNGTVQKPFVASIIDSTTVPIIYETDCFGKTKQTYLDGLIVIFSNLLAKWLVTPREGFARERGNLEKQLVKTKPPIAERFCFFLVLTYHTMQSCGNRGGRQQKIIPFRKPLHLLYSM